MISEYQKVFILILFFLLVASYVRMDLSSYLITAKSLAENLKKAFTSFSLANLVLAPGDPPDWGFVGQVYILGLGYYDTRDNLSHYRTLDLHKFSYIIDVDQYSLALRFGFKNMLMHIGLYDTITGNLLYIDENSCTNIQNYATQGYKPLSVGPPLPNYITQVQVPVLLVCPSQDGSLQEITYTKLSGESYTKKYIPAILLIQLAYA